MNKRKPFTRQMAERTAKGAVRFNLGFCTQSALKGIIQDAANRPKPMTLNTEALMKMAFERAKAQEMLTKRAFLLMPLLGEYSFTLPESEALVLLLLLYKADFTGKPELAYLFTFLHQTLS
jgi:hypothetical protein